MRISIRRWGAVLLCGAACARAEVLIDGDHHNGGLVSASVGLNVTSLSGWTALRGVWISSGNSSLTASPFGPDGAAQSRSVQIHNDAGETLTSAAVFTVAAGDVIRLSLDYQVGGSGNDTTLTLSLWDTAALTTYATLGVIRTDTPQPTFRQVDYAHTAGTVNSNLCLRFTLSSAGGLGKDVHLDRIHLSGGVLTPPQPIVYATSQALLAHDTPERIIEKAAKTLPEPKQVDWQRMETTFFIHFGPNTFNGVEWGTGYESPSVFNPTAFDAAQWVHAIQQAGGKMVMLVVKHHEGFCLYPSRYTTHDVASSPWMDGAGDVVRAVSDACAALGIPFGIYLSPADLYQIHSAFSYGEGSGYYGNGSATRLSTIPTDPAAFGSDPTQGRTPPHGFRSYQYPADDYNRYFFNQLYELLTEYGDIAEVWFDGANPEPGYDQAYNYADWYEMIYDLQPNACIAVGGPDVRWVGNESGVARLSEWSVIPKPYSSGTATDLGSRAQLVAGKTTEWYPAEADTKILSGWFWKSTHSVKDASALLDIYYTSVGRNANLLLNLSPDTTGRIPANQLTPLQSFAQVVRNTFAHNWASDAVVTAPEDSVSSGDWLRDGDLDTFWEAAESLSAAELTFDWPSDRVMNVVSLQEPIAQRGQRVEEFSVDTWDGASWVTQGSGTTIGHKRLIKFTSEVTTRRVRVRITACRLNPSLAEVGFYKEAVAIAAPTISGRDADGFVTLSGTAGLTLRYTTDGSAPDGASPVYSGAIALPFGGVVSAASFDADGLPGLMVTRAFPSLSPTGWMATADGASGLNTADRAVDESPSTYWQSAATDLPHSIVLDMGRTRCIGGFTYLPASEGGAGTIKTYRFETSPDSIAWTPRAEGEFGNIQFSPVLQSVTFLPVMARYVRFTALSEIFGNSSVVVPEIGVIPAGFDAWRRDRSIQTASAADDADLNGIPALLEYALVVEPGVAADLPLLEMYPGADGGLRLRMRQRTELPDVAVTLEGRRSLATEDEWQDIGMGAPGPTQDNGDGSSTLERTLAPEAGEAHFFYRLRYDLQ